MRVFLCSYSSFTMAVPIDSVSSITIFREETGKKIEYNSENGNTYISLPLLFDCGAEKIKHGIIIKNTAEMKIDYSAENRFILLTTEIESETNISDASIFSVPKNLGVTKFAHCFSSIIFNNNKEGLILLLNPLQLVKNIQKELIK
ncbi:MAG: hypothetical protein FWC19_00360 [Treponema sp.]|nr:hypothetical protein [Treponema sp.]